MSFLLASHPRKRCDIFAKLTLSLNDLQPAATTTASISSSTSVSATEPTRFHSWA